MVDGPLTGGEVHKLDPCARAEHVLLRGLGTITAVMEPKRIDGGRKVPFEWRKGPVWQCETLKKPALGYLLCSRLRVSIYYGYSFPQGRRGAPWADQESQGRGYGSLCG